MSNRSAPSSENHPRQPDAPQPAVDAFRARHLASAHGEIVDRGRPRRVTIDEAESPLAWLARRRAGAAATAAR